MVYSEAQFVLRNFAAAPDEIRLSAPLAIPRQRPGRLAGNIDRQPSTGNQSSKGGVPLLREVERKYGVCQAMLDRRDSTVIRHAMFEGVMLRLLAICLRARGCHRPRPVAVRRADEFRGRPLFGSGQPLASQSSMSQDAPSKIEAAHETDRDEVDCDCARPFFVRAEAKRRF
jgi:hypothetical protein